MANKKSTKKTKSTKASTSKSASKSKQSQQSTVEKAVKKAYKKNPKAVVISIVAIVLIIAIAFAILYFGFPDIWKELVSRIDKGDDGGSSIDAEDTSKVVGGNLHGVLTRGDGELLFHMIDVGQGDCLYVQLPDGKDMVIDGGTTKKPNDDFSEKTVINYMNNYIKDGTIEYLMLTHTDKDHVSFLDDIIDEFAVENIYMPYILAKPNVDNLSSKVRSEFEKIPQEKKDIFKDKDTVSTAEYAEFFAAALNEENCTIHVNMDDDEKTNNIDLSGSNYSFKFYCPTKAYYDENDLGNATDLNAISPVGILEYKNRRIMFTGDSNTKNEKIIAKRTGAIDCDVLKVAHHGSATSSIESFLKQYSFEYAMISSGTHAGHKLPRQDALDRMKDMEVYRTDKNGTIVLSVNSRGDMDFKAEKKSTQKQNHIGNDVQMTTQTALSRKSIPMNMRGLFFINAT